MIAGNALNKLMENILLRISPILLGCQYNTPDVDIFQRVPDFDKAELRTKREHTQPLRAYPIQQFFPY
jgi:hypothetical protein